MNKEVLELGERLIKELKLETNFDTLSHWMAHYIAQLMSEINSSSGDEKQIAEDKCFDTILKLWKHKAYYETGKRPFDNFTPIFETLDKLNPDNQEPFYFQPSYSTKDRLDNSGDPVKQYLFMATKIDEIVRIWLRFIFQEAVELASDEETKEWIKLAAPFAENDEASSIVRFISERKFDDSKTDSEDDPKKLYQRRIEQLKSFREFNEELISMYEEKLSSVDYKS